MGEITVSNKSSPRSPPFMVHEDKSFGSKHVFIDSPPLSEIEVTATIKQNSKE